MSWDILIPSLAHRGNLLVELLECLEPQICRGVSVRVYRDDREVGYTDKLNTLIQSSKADYVCFVDDDDLVAPNYVKRVLTAMRRHPDYVGFRLRYTKDGVPQLPVFHSLRYPHWYDDANGFYRDFQQFQPIRRDLVAPWVDHGYLSDRHWAGMMRSSRRVKDEVFVNAELYYYRYQTADSMGSTRWNGVDPVEVDQDRFDWVVWL